MIINDKYFFNDSLVKEFSYHDGVIIEFKKINNDFLIKFKDGWLDNQINEILFVDCIEDFDNKFSCFEIYQFEDLSYNENKGFTMVLEVLSKKSKSPFADVISFMCKNIICKKYENGILVSKEDLSEFIKNK